MAMPQASLANDFAALMGATNPYTAAAATAAGVPSQSTPLVPQALQPLQPPPQVVYQQQPPQAVPMPVATAVIPRPAPQTGAPRLPPGFTSPTVDSNLRTAQPGVQPWIVATLVSVLVIGIVLILIFAVWKPFEEGNGPTTPTVPLVPAVPVVPALPAVAPASPAAIANQPWTALMTQDPDVNSHIKFAIEKKGLAGEAARTWAVQRVRARRAAAMQERRQAQAKASHTTTPAATTPVAMTPASPPREALVVPPQSALFPTLHEQEVASRTGEASSEASALPPGTSPLPWQHM